ncbi:hypothetical protein [Nocardioides sp. SR21]|uniref:hypothetical protein n=1 Tax=Nocardioides sp. SR21 TaxID=2919501 RepID=UPI001FAA98F9|nr:hypothetical protein [Nocardioides sp. SR21]
MDILALSVHGPAGVLDLAVPASADAADVAEEYARRSGLASVPELHTRTGAPIPSGTELTRAGIGAGDLLVATTGITPAVTSRGVSHQEVRREPGGLSTLWFCVAAAAAALAGWCARTEPEPTVWVLLAAAAIGVVPTGRFAAHRVVAAPAFAAAAAFAAAWDPHPVRLPMVLGVTGLAAALAAAVGRALAPRAEEALRIWIIVGAGVFVLTGLCALAGAPPRMAWALLLMGALLAARFVPGLAIDVPDQYLIDLERLAVTAWSAREQPSGKRGRSVVPVDAVGVVAARGTRLVTAACAAILVVAVVSSPLLLATATLPIDRVGARCLVGFAGAGLLLAARSYRHAAARALLRTAGLGCWVALLAVLLGDLPDGTARWFVVGAVALAVVLVVVAVAVGRGWRSAWWSRRAEVAESLSVAFALASVVVAVGWFRQLWELASLWEMSS